MLNVNIFFLFIYCFMEQYNICVYDSGIGGLDIARRLNKTLRLQKIIYFCDSKNMPYGNKSFFKLKKIIIKNVEFLIHNYKIKIFVLACNTATMVALKELREKFKDVWFVGTEPAIKPALNNLEKKDKILVLCTKNTKKYSKILKKYKKNKQITIFAVKKLAHLIENNYFKLNTIFNEVSVLFKKLLVKNYTRVVLGCTHYPFIKNHLQKIFTNAIFFDGAEGVVKQTVKIVRDCCKHERVYIKSTIKRKKFLLSFKKNYLSFNNNKFDIISSKKLNEKDIKKYLNQPV